MSTYPIVRRQPPADVREGRLPNLQTLAEANGLPDSADRIPLGQRQTIISIEHSKCRWPIGDPQDKGFFLCGAETGENHSYCAHHMKIAYVASRPRRNG